MAGKFELPNEVVEVRYVKKQRGLITNEKHVAYGGLLEKAKITYRPAKLDNGQYKNVLTDDEKDILEVLLNLPKNGLSIYNKDNYWDTVKILLGKDSIFLKLSDPIDYIKYKVLLGFPNQVCTDLSLVDRKPTYRYVIVRKDDEAKVALKKVDIMKEAYKLLGRLEDNREASTDFLMFNGIRVASDTSLESINAMVAKELQESPKKFVAILKDPSYTTKVLLQKALAKGEIVKKNNQYYTKEGAALSENNKPSTLENTIEYLESNINQEYKLLLMSQV